MIVVAPKLLIQNECSVIFHQRKICVIVVVVKIIKKPVRLSYLHLACGSIRLIKIVIHTEICYHIYWNMASY